MYINIYKHVYIFIYIYIYISKWWYVHHTNFPVSAVLQMDPTKSPKKGLKLEFLGKSMGLGGVHLADLWNRKIASPWLYLLNPQFTTIIYLPNWGKHAISDLSKFKPPADSVPIANEKKMTWWKLTRIPKDRKEWRATAIWNKVKHIPCSFSVELKRMCFVGPDFVKKSLGTYWFRWRICCFSTMWVYGIWWFHLNIGHPKHLKVSWPNKLNIARR